MTAIQSSPPSTHGFVKSKKRKRSEHSQAQKERKSPKVVGVNALPWNEVPFPEILDDAEGFFGLEEISDVEIVKDDKSGWVEFRVGEGIPYTVHQFWSFADNFST